MRGRVISKEVYLPLCTYHEGYIHLSHLDREHKAWLAGTLGPPTVVPRDLTVNSVGEDPSPESDFLSYSASAPAVLRLLFHSWQVRIPHESVLPCIMYA